MKWKPKVDLATASLLILIGVTVLLFPILKISDINTIFLIVMIAEGIVYFARFLLTKEYRDYEGIFCCISSIIIGIISFFYKPNTSALHLMRLLFAWIILKSLIKLKKADYYHDRNNKMWKSEIAVLMLFILSGVLTTMNLNYEPNVQIFMLGYFLLINGILEGITPFIIALTKERIKK